MQVPDQFEPEDDEAFRKLTTDLLALNAHTERGLSAQEYLRLARQVWASCEKDSVYAIKLLFDPLVQPQFREESERDLFCVLVARVGHAGEFIDAPPGYTPPDYPGVRFSHIVAGSPSGGYEPDVSKAQPYLLAYFDVLGFEALLVDVGLHHIHERYQQLLDQALRPQSHERPWSRAQSLVRGEVVPALMWLPMRAAHFSDSLLLWVHYHPDHVGEFLARCSRVFCKALDLGIPLRGAITIGEAVLDNHNNIFLGSPLVEAARLESKQDWVGVALGTSFKSASPRVPIPPEAVFPYVPPLKTGGSDLFSDIVLDWPRTWRQDYSASAVERLQTLAGADLPDALRQRYIAAATFYEASGANEDWFFPQASDDKEV